LSSSELPLIGSVRLVADALAKLLVGKRLLRNSLKSLSAASGGRSAQTTIVRAAPSTSSTWLQRILVAFIAGKLGRLSVVSSFDSLPNPRANVDRLLELSEKCGPHLRAEGDLSDEPAFIQRGSRLWTIRHFLQTPGTRRCLNFRASALGGPPNERCAQKARRCRNDIVDR
jgi:hypothetical protein